MVHIPIKKRQVVRRPEIVVELVQGNPVELFAPDALLQEARILHREEHKIHARQEKHPKGKAKISFFVKMVGNEKEYDPVYDELLYSIHHPDDGTQEGRQRQAGYECDQENVFHPEPDRQFASVEKRTEQDDCHEQQGKMKHRQVRTIVLGSNDQDDDEEEQPDLRFIECEDHEAYDYRDQRGDPIWHGSARIPSQHSLPDLFRSVSSRLPA